ncbi:hypothetical protein SNEBB_009536 [Seison nebaliae]|nr:hypothetical protein SNEBB_009536 [Seison nebaliae]
MQTALMPMTTQRYPLKTKEITNAENLPYSDDNSSNNYFTHNIPPRLTPLMNPTPNVDAKASVAYSDVTNNDYVQLRRPRRITFFKNGEYDRKGKILYITPNRYMTFQELKFQLDKSIKLPYGVRRIFDFNSGYELHNIDELKDGCSYICTSFEPLRLDRQPISFR